MDLNGHKLLSFIDPFEKTRKHYQCATNTHALPVRKGWWRRCSYMSSALGIALTSFSSCTWCEMNGTGWHAVRAASTILFIDQNEKTRNRQQTRITVLKMHAARERHPYYSWSTPCKFHAIQLLKHCWSRPRGAMRQLQWQKYDISEKDVAVLSSCCILRCTHYSGGTRCW